MIMVREFFLLSMSLHVLTFSLNANDMDVGNQVDAWIIQSKHAMECKKV